MNKLKSTFILASLFSIPLFFSSCATLLRGHNDGDFKNGINIVSSKTVSNFKCNVNGSDYDGRVVYDGTQFTSPFIVYRVNIKGHPRHLEVKIGDLRYKVTRTHKPGWFWVGGCWVFVDIITGAYYYYPDLIAD